MAFADKFGADLSQAQTLIEAKTLTISKLMTIMPTGIDRQIDSLKVIYIECMIQIDRQIDRADFLQTLIEAKNLTISKLMTIIPTGRNIQIDRQVASFIQVYSVRWVDRQTGSQTKKISRQIKHFFKIFFYFQSFKIDLFRYN